MISPYDKFCSCTMIECKKLTDECFNEFCEQDWNFLVADVSRLIEVVGCGIKPTEETSKIVTCHLVKTLRQILLRAITMASQTRTKPAPNQSPTLPLNSNTIHQALNRNPSKQLFFEKTLQQLKDLKNMFQAY